MKKLIGKQTRRLVRALRRVEPVEHRINREVLARLPRRGLDLGSGPTPRNKFQLPEIEGLDLTRSQDPRVHFADLSGGRIPRQSSSVCLITAYDFIEHVPRYARDTGGPVFPFVLLMSEVFRVLKPGGLFLSRTPAFPAPEAFQDPTHVNIITKKTFTDYFCAPKIWAGAYGFHGGFKLVLQDWDKSHLVTLLEKPAMVIPESKCEP